MDLNYKEIGKRVKIARLNCEYTQEKISELTGLSLSHISNIETGNTKVSLPSLVKICNALNVSVDEVLMDNVITYRYHFANEVIRLCDECNDIQKKLIKGLIETVINTLK